MGLSSISNNLLFTFKILLISCLRLTGAPNIFPGSVVENIVPRFGDWKPTGRGHGRLSGVNPWSCPEKFELFLGPKESRPKPGIHRGKFYPKFLPWSERKPESSLKLAIPGLSTWLWFITLISLNGSFYYGSHTSRNWWITI